MRILCLIALFVCSVFVSGQNKDVFFGLGWNLGNQLDAHKEEKADETCWGNGKVTQRTFDCVRSAGFSSVRIPVTWLGHIGPSPEYKISEAWLERVAECVGYAKKAGLKVIVNIHHDGANSDYWLNVRNAAKNDSVNNLVKAKLTAVWQQIARRFKNEGDYLVFESFNEIHDGKWGWGENLTDNGRQYEIVNEWNQTFVDAVRRVGGRNKKRYLGVPGYCTNIDLTLKYFRMPKDVVRDRLMLSVHYYEPYNFTLENRWNEWGYKAPKNNGQYKDECHVDSIFGLLKQRYVDKGVQVYIGEFGCTRRVEPADEYYRKYYLSYVCRSASRNGLSLFYWDNGVRGAGRERSGLINHANGDFIETGAEIVDVMYKAYHSE